MIMYENYQYGNYRRGCGTLKASGGDYGGGSENLICTKVMTSDRLRTSMMRWMPKKPLVGVHAKTRMGNGLTFAPLVSTRLPHLILEVSYEKSRDIGCCKGLCLR